MNNTEIPARAQRRRYMRYVKSIGSNRHFVRVPMRIGPKTKFLQSTINGTLGDATQKAEEFWLTLAVQRGLKPNEAKRFDSILLNYIEYICRRKSGKNATNIARITNRIIGYLGYIKVKSKILFCQEFERKLQELVAKGETSFHDDIIEFSHAAFKVGMNDGIITFNPIDTSLIIDKASKRKRRTENLSLQEFELLLDSLPYYLWPLIITKWENPSRTKEITENKKSQYAQKGDDKFPVNTGKGGPHRILAIATCLFEFRDSLPPGLDPIATKYENGEYVPIKEFYDDWDIARNAIGRPDLHVHDLRGISGSILQDIGATNEIICGIGGWTNFDTYLRDYGRNNEKAIDYIRLKEKFEKKCAQKGVNLSDFLIGPSNSLLSNHIYNRKTGKIILKDAFVNYLFGDDVEDFMNSEGATNEKPVL